MTSSATIPADNEAPRTARLVAWMALGFVAVLSGGALIFTAIARHLGPDSAMVRSDHALADLLAQRTPAAVVQVLALLTHLGDPVALAVICAAFAFALWRLRRRTLAVALVLAVGGNAVLNRSLKAVFERARPPYGDLVAPADGYSFPSGHTSGTLVAYGMLAYLAMRLLPRRWHSAALVAVALTVIVVAGSRIVLRAHFTSDVIAGLVSGGTWLAVCIGSAELARHVALRRAGGTGAGDRPGRTD